VFRHELPFDRSSLSRWRRRLGEERLSALLQESLAVAHKTGALGGKDLERVTVDITVQPKAIANLTDARLLHRALVKLVAMGKREGITLRQSYVRVAKRAAIMIGRYSHAHQFKRARRGWGGVGQFPERLRCAAVSDPSRPKPQRSTQPASTGRPHTFRVPGSVATRLRP
jgi:hypothetical protein